VPAPSSATSLNPGLWVYSVNFSYSAGAPPVATIGRWKRETGRHLTPRLVEGQRVAIGAAVVSTSFGSRMTLSLTGTGIDVQETVNACRAACQRRLVQALSELTNEPIKIKNNFDVDNPNDHS
jgi:hypothetical protein